MFGRKKRKIVKKAAAKSIAKKAIQLKKDQQNNRSIKKAKSGRS
jgi:hypothetical protein